MGRSIVCRTLIVAIASGVAASAPAPRVWAACNAIPAPSTDFQTVPPPAGTTAGVETRAIAMKTTVSRPFAAPGDAVKITREQPVFSADAGQNLVTLTFRPPDGPPIPPFVNVMQAKPCGDGASCQGDLCACVEFVFPSLPDGVSAAGNGGLTGPVEIDVSTGGVPTAHVAGSLAPSGPTASETVFASFVALPAFNSFKALLGTAGEVLAAEEGPQTILVPLDVGDLAPVRLPDDLPDDVPIVEAHIPGLSGVKAGDLKSFSPEGQALSISALPVGSSENVLGTLDGRYLVLRIDNVGSGQIRFAGGGGGAPLVIPGVTAYHDPLKDAVGTPVFTNRHVVYETKDPADTLHHELRTFDLTKPLAESAYVNDVRLDPAHLLPDGTIPDCGNFKRVLPAGLQPYEAYRILASDSVVAFVIPSCFRLGPYKGSELRSVGAYDVVGSEPVAIGPDPSVGVWPLALDGDTLVYTTAKIGDGEAKADLDQVYFHKAPGDTGARTTDITLPHPARTGRARCRPGRACPAAAYPIPGLGVSNDVGRIDIGKNGRVAYLINESGHDLNDNSSSRDLVLFLYDPVEGRALNLLKTGTRPGNVVFNKQWIGVEVPGDGGRGQVVAVLDSDNPGYPRRLICKDGPGSGYLVSAKGDAFLSCAIASDRHLNPRKDRRWRRRFKGRYLLHAFLPNLYPTLDREFHVGTALASPDDVVAVDSFMAIGRDDPAQCEDVKHPVKPNTIGGPYSVDVLDILTRQLISTHADVVVPRAPLLGLRRNFGGEYVLTIVTGGSPSDPTGTVGVTDFLQLPSKTAGKPGDACRLVRDCNDHDPCTVDDCEEGVCKSTPLRGVAGLDCALGRLLTTPFCGPDAPIPASLAISTRRNITKAIANLPRERCPSPEDGTWRPVHDHLKVVSSHVGRIVKNGTYVLPACGAYLSDLVKEASCALGRARGVSDDRLLAKSCPMYVSEIASGTP